jgi:phospholipid/cholesterol/gamma-HCH transport system permease protein
MDAARPVMKAPPARSFAGRYFDYIGHRWLALLRTIRGVGSFALITLGVTVTKFGHSTRVIHPLIGSQIRRAGVRLLPMVFFLGAALGLVIIGQTVALLTRVGAQQYIGTVMNTVVFRELGPLAAAMMVLGRVGTATVVELGTKRAQGEIDALEALGIDPVHYLVVPRVIGLGLSIFSLTIYLILVVMLSGMLFAFLTDVPISPTEYFGQIANGLTYQDFGFLAVKTILFGTIIAVVTCYHGLAQPIRLEQVAEAATRAVSQSVTGCLILDAFFILLYVVLSAK